MHLTKKHFYTLIAINSLLPILLALIKGIDKDSWVFLIICAIVALASLFLFIICWILYFIFTAGKEPTYKFHTIAQLLMTVSIISFVGYQVYKDWVYEYYEANIIYNADFLDSHGFSTHDSLYKNAFKLLEAKFENKNDLRLHAFTTSKFDTTNYKIYDSVRILYFFYGVNNNSKELASKHLIGNKINKLLLYNVPVSFLPGIRNAKKKIISEEEKDLTQLLLYYKNLPEKEKDKEMIKIVESELERIRKEKF
jgi:hypothetical protein